MLLTGDLYQFPAELDVHRSRRVRPTVQLPRLASGWRPWPRESMPRSGSSMISSACRTSVTRLNSTTEGSSIWRARSRLCG